MRRRERLCEGAPGAQVAPPAVSPLARKQVVLLLLPLSRAILKGIEEEKKRQFISHQSAAPKSQ